MDPVPARGWAIAADESKQKTATIPEALPQSLVLLSGQPEAHSATALFASAASPHGICRALPCASRRERHPPRISSVSQKPGPLRSCARQNSRKLFDGVPLAIHRDGALRNPITLVRHRREFKDLAQPGLGQARRAAEPDHGFQIGSGDHGHALLQRRPDLPAQAKGEVGGVEQDQGSRRGRRKPALARAQSGRRCRTRPTR